jgi:hypothetical protein
MHTTQDLEAYPDAWADKFVDTNLCLHLVSWLQQLEDAYLGKPPKLKVHLGKTPFVVMWVTKNYVSVAHTDRNIFHFVIS